MNKPLLVLASFFAFGLSHAAPELVNAAVEPLAVQPKNPIQQDTVEKDQPKPDVLVNPEWLEKNAKSPDVRLIGLGQKQEQYELAHIPGEVFVDWRTEITDPKHPDRFNLPPKAQIEKLLSRLGVTKDTTIVLTDNLSSRLSARMFWTLRYYGHKNIKLLDGGRKGWVQSGRGFTREVPKIKPTRYVTGDHDTSQYANLAAVKANLEDEDCVLIDGRPTKQYTGELPGKAYHNEKEHKRKGHIVNAKNIVWKDNFNDDGTFKSVEELKKLYDSSGATSHKGIITYCNEGLHAAPPWFVLTELLGHSNVKLYDDSMSEWANRDNTPMEMSVKKEN